MYTVTNQTRERRVPTNADYVEYYIVETGEIQQCYSESCLKRSEIDFLNKRFEEGDYILLTYASEAE